MATYYIESGDKKLVLTDCYRRCTRCERMLDLEYFGFRRMGDGYGTVAVQPRCTTCRSKQAEDKNQMKLRLK